MDNAQGEHGARNDDRWQEGDLVVAVYFLIARLRDALVLAVHAALAREVRARVALAVELLETHFLVLRTARAGARR
jgi:hypothetical protein